MFFPWHEQGKHAHLGHRHPHLVRVCLTRSFPTLPFANERSGTIRLKTNPQEAFAEFEEEERASQETKETKEDVPMDEANKSLLKTPTRSSNRTAGDVMDDISSMLADLTDELDSMLCSESV